MDVVEQLLPPHVDLGGDVELPVLVLLALEEHPVREPHVARVQLDPEAKEMALKKNSGVAFALETFDQMVKSQHEASDQSRALLNKTYPSNF